MTRRDRAHGRKPRLSKLHQRIVDLANAEVKSGTVGNWLADIADINEAEILALVGELINTRAVKDSIADGFEVGVSVAEQDEPTNRMLSRLDAMVTEGAVSEEGETQEEAINDLYGPFMMLVSHIAMTAMSRGMALGVVLERNRRRGEVQRAHYAGRR
jgi:hypothetical protein